MNSALSIAPHVAPVWRIVAAQGLGDGTYALTLLCGSDDATAVVSWRWVGMPRGDVLLVDACSSEDALDWLTDHAEQAWDACFLGRAS